MLFKREFVSCSSIAAQKMKFSIMDFFSKVTKSPGITESTDIY